MKKIFLMLAVLAMSGCASIMDGNTQNVNFITSNGQSANATIYTKDGARQSRIPQSMTIKKSSEDIVIRTNRSGTETRVPARLNNWFWGNIIFGGFFGSTTDACTGAMWKYDENVMVQVPEQTRYYQYQTNEYQGNRWNRY